MRRVRDDHLVPRCPLACVMSPNHEHTSQLPMSACRWLKRDRMEPDDFCQHLLEFIHEVENSLGEGFPLVRVGLSETRQAAQILVDLRVVFHGARTERIQPEVDGVVPLGEARVMAYHIHLADLGKSFDLWAHMVTGEHVLGTRLGNVGVGERVSPSSWMSLFKYEWFAQNETLDPQGLLGHDGLLSRSVTLVRMSHIRSISARLLISVAQKRR